MEPLVSICTLAYNHEPYIRECLDGFLMQKTDFKFEVLIHDDASTDNTAKIIREYQEKYPDIIKPIYQTENQYWKNIGISRTYQYPRAKGKYIALCEGDDYWIDPYKLQKQVDFLEEHPDCGLCYTGCQIYNQKINKFRLSNAKQLDKFSLLERNHIPTLTVCFRKDLCLNYYKEVAPNLPNLLMGDLPLWLYFTNVSEIKYLNFVSAVYRELVDSASHSKNYKKQIAFYESARLCKDYFHEHYDYPAELKDSYNSYINTLILWKAILLNSKEGFKENFRLVDSTKKFSVFLWIYFKLTTISFTLFSPIGRIINKIRYK